MNSRLEISSKNDFLSVHRKNELSVVFESEFFFMKENNGVFLYGESLALWMSIGGLIKGNVQMIREKKKYYYKGEVSSAIFFSFFCDRGDVFEMSVTWFGYKAKLKRGTYGSLFL